MVEIKCPKCGEKIKLDKSTYDSLLSTIEKEEIEERVKQSESRIEDKYKAEFALKEQSIKNAQNEKIAELTKNVALLTEKLSNSAKEAELAVSKAIDQTKKELSEKDVEIAKLKADSKLELKEAEEKYKTALSLKEEEIKRYKEFRMGDSTKDLGESLEQFCHDAFNEIRMTSYPHAYFEKDNDVDEEGKGDFIFKDFSEDGIEIVSIMFEMKNQKDDTEHKHKNEEFFKKLDKNRTSKGCEYAVLVTTLEEDSKLYNSGIVDVSYRYPKMFVVRPQFFLTIIGLIRNMALSSFAYKKQVIEYKKENLDITNFEDAVKMVTDKITADYEKAGAIYSEVDKMCDDIVKKVETFRKEFKTATGWIEKAKNQLPNLEVRKLTRSNQTMKEKFKELEDNKTK